MGARTLTHSRPARTVRPNAVILTADPLMPLSPGSTSTNSAMTASSQTGIRGHDVRHASMVSPYVRGRAATHASNSTIRAPGADGPGTDDRSRGIAPSFVTPLHESELPVHPIYAEEGPGMAIQ